MRPSSTRLFPVVVGVILAMYTAACSAGSPAVDVEIAAPAPGSRVTADVPVALTVRLDGAELIDDAHDEDDHDAATGDGGRRGHLHVFVDGQIVSMLSELEPEVTLTPGSHTVTVEFVDEDHLSLEPPVTDEIALEAR